MQNNALPEIGEVRRGSGVTFYHQLYVMLLGALDDGIIAAGSALPSESEMMSRFSVSRNTVRQALARLEKEKRIVRRRGSGSYARSTPPADVTHGTIVDMVHDADAANMQISSRLVRVQSCETPEFIRRKDSSFAHKSLLIQRCHSVRTTPFMFSTSYVPELLAARLTRRQLSREAPLTALESLGFKAAGAEQMTTAIAADPTVADHLGVEAAAPLLCVHRLVKSEDGRTIEHGSHLFRPDRFQLRSRAALERSAAGSRWLVAESMDMPAWL